MLSMARCLTQSLVCLVARMSSDPLRETASVWTDVDVAALCLMLGTGCDIADIAQVLHRTVEECERKARSIGRNING
jgi:hypothetical protein